jgi:hypothetical protein
MIHVSNCFVEFFGLSLGPGGIPTALIPTCHHSPLHCKVRIRLRIQTPWTIEIGQSGKSVDIVNMAFRHNFFVWHMIWSEIFSKTDFEAALYGISGEVVGTRPLRSIQ